VPHLWSKCSASNLTGQEYDEENALQYYGARYMDNEVGRFTAIDPVLLDSEFIIRKLSNAQSLNSYAYTENNPIINTDPLGLDSALIIYGHNTRRGEENAFRDLAQKSADRLQESDVDNTYDDGIYVVEGYTFNQWQDALENYKDINRIEYWGHGYEGGLNISDRDSQYNREHILTSYDPYFDSNSDHYISDLYAGNVTDNVQTHINSCNSATKWKEYGGNSTVAKEFSDHFGGSAKGYASFINYRDDGTPFVRLQRRLITPRLWFSSPEKWFSSN